MVRPFAEQQKSQTKYSLSVYYEKRISRKSSKLLQKFGVLGHTLLLQPLFRLETD
ncbi:MAG: hypothetical protein CG439_305 [Methylococcaceae bacterium NSP1-2]|nr:MAG: hypothetical protein CG439_305 [Methylococcaceae bacterium NSP1-2]